MKGAGQWRFLMVGGPHHGTWMTFNRYALEDIYENRYYYVRDPQPMTYERYETVFDVPPVTMYSLRRFDAVSGQADRPYAFLWVLIKSDVKGDGWLVMDAMQCVTMPEPNHPRHWGGV